MKKLAILLLLSISVVAQGADESLILYLPLNEGQGSMVMDASDFENEGEIVGDAVWVEGNIGMALEIVSGSHVLIPEIPEYDVISEVTLMAWIRTTYVTTWARLIDKSQWQLNGYDLALRQDSHVPMFEFFVDNTTSQVNATTPADDGEWHFVAGTFGNQTLRIYVDGIQEGESQSAGGVDINPNDWPIMVGAESSSGGGQQYVGAIDEVAVFARELSGAKIANLFENPMVGEPNPDAFGPDPKDGAMLEATWATLNWKAGDFAVSHDVYLGESYHDVSNATVDSDVFRGNQVATFYVAGFPGFAYPDGLVPGTTYYWRIDEVNDADPNSPWKGDVWRFSIPPKTAYNPDPADGAQFVDPNTTKLSWTAGFGAILHTVYFGDDYDTVNNAAGGPPSGTTTYNPGPLELEKVYYWRVDEFDAIETHKGDIWSFTTPGAVGNPNPAFGATDVGLNARLSWMPADSAASHQLYFGTDKEAVRTAGAGAPENKGSIALSAERYDPGLLEANTTYYWRVDEVDAQGNTLTGPVWIFTTGTFLLVEDFESYTDDDAAGQAIWQHWIDGFGVPDNGSQVGNLLPPYAEQAIVHGGSQSMPLSYVNEAGVTNSEASKTLTALRDWTQAGVVELSLWFRGVSANAPEPLYGAIFNAAGAPAIVAYDDAAAATSSRWTEWRIVLQAFADQGIDLTNVDKIAIGLGSQSGMAVVGGTGTIYIDDIRLYRPKQ